MDINIGDNVLCYSCEQRRIEKRPRDKERFSGIVVAIGRNVVTVRNKRGHDMYYPICCLEKLNN